MNNIFWFFSTGQVGFLHFLQDSALIGHMLLVCQYFDHHTLQTKYFMYTIMGGGRDGGGFLNVYTW